MKIFDEQNLVAEIMHEAKILRIPAGAAQQTAEKVAKSVARWAEKRVMITDEELNQKIAAIMQKYNPDLAYVFQNRGKII